LLLIRIFLFLALAVVLVLLLFLLFFLSSFLLLVFHLKILLVIFNLRNELFSLLDLEFIDVVEDFQHPVKIFLLVEVQYDVKFVILLIFGLLESFFQLVVVRSIENAVDL
jgi:hypothetical protein